MTPRSGTPGQRALADALKSLKSPKSAPYKNVFASLLALQKTHAGLESRFDERASKHAKVAAKLMAPVVRAKAYVDEMRVRADAARRRGNGEFVAQCEKDVAVAESLYSVATEFSRFVSSTVADDQSDNVLRDWYDKLVALVAKAETNNNAKDNAIAVITGGTILAGVTTGAVGALVAAAVAGVLLAGDLLSKLREAKERDDEIARLEVAGLMIDTANTIGERLLTILKSE